MSSSTTEHPLPKAKLAAVLKFNSFADSFKSKKKPDITFPPPSWFIKDDNTDSESDAEGAIPPVENGVERSDSEMPEPITFAEKLKRLIDKLPIPSSLAAVVGAGPIPREELPGVLREGGEGPAIPDGVDSETIKLLASQNVMNGDEGEEGVHATRKRESVWSALDRLNPRHHHHAIVEGGMPLGLDTERGVMVYAPLEPTNESQVELAESHEVSRPEAGEEEQDEAVLRKDKGKSKETDSGPAIASPTPTPTEKVWVPSTTRISVLTTWWGYRLYLPPPVMATLNSNQLKATKRAAMITTALQWLLSKLPLKLLPPNLRVPVTMLRRLGPFVGYIGVFMAWTWTRICACDQGDYSFRDWPRLGATYHVLNNCLSRFLFFFFFFVASHEDLRSC